MRKDELIIGNYYRYFDTVVTSYIHAKLPAYQENKLEENLLFSRLRYIGRIGHGHQEIIENAVHGYKNAPVFKAEVVRGGDDDFYFSLDNCAPICRLNITTTGEQRDPEKGTKTRKEAAVAVRERIGAWSARVENLRGKMVSLEAKISAAERRAHMLEEYDTDEEALAATIARILQTEGTESEIHEILKEFGFSYKL